MGHWTARIISKRKELSFQEVSSPSLEVIKQRQITALQGCHGWSRYRLSGWCTGSLQALCPRGRWSSVASWGSRRSLFDLRDDFFHMSLRTKSVSSLFSLSGELLDAYEDDLMFCFYIVFLKIKTVKATGETPRRPSILHLYSSPCPSIIFMLPLSLPFLLPPILSFSSFLFSFFKKIYWSICSWVTVLCWIVLYSKVTQFCVYIFLFTRVYHRVLNIVPRAVQQNLAIYPPYI